MPDISPIMAPIMRMRSPISFCCAPGPGAVLPIIPGPICWAVTGSANARMPAANSEDNNVDVVECCFMLFPFCFLNCPTQRSQREPFFSETPEVLPSNPSGLRQSLLQCLSKHWQFRFEIETDRFYRFHAPRSICRQPYHLVNSLWNHCRLMTLTSREWNRADHRKRLLVHHPYFWRLAAGDIHFSGSRDLVEMLGLRRKRQDALFAGLGVEGHQLVIRAAADEKRFSVVTDVQTVYSLPDLVGRLDFAFLDRYNGNRSSTVVGHVDRFFVGGKDQMLRRWPGLK